MLGTFNAGTKTTCVAGARSADPEGATAALQAPDAAGDHGANLVATKHGLALLRCGLALVWVVDCKKPVCDSGAGQSASKNEGDCFAHGSFPTDPPPVLNSSLGELVPADTENAVNPKTGLATSRDECWATCEQMFLGYTTRTSSHSVRHPQVGGKPPFI